MLFQSALSCLLSLVVPDAVRCLGSSTRGSGSHRMHASGACDGHKGELSKLLGPQCISLLHALLLAGTAVPLQAASPGQRTGWGCHIAASAAHSPVQPCML